MLQCQNPDQTAAFATGVLPYIYAFYRYTWSSAVLFCSLADQFPEPVRVEPIPFTPDLICHLRTHYAQSFRITLPTYVYRGCWHVVSRDFLVRYHHSLIIPYECRFSLTTELYDPKTFLTHAALLVQGSPH